MKKFVFHVLGISFTATSQKYLGDAPTQNVLMMCRLLKMLGHRVIHYGNYGSEADCDEHIEILNEEEMNRLYQDEVQLHKSNVGYFVKESKELYEKFGNRAIMAIHRNAKQGEFILGVRFPHFDIAQRIPNIIYAQHSVGHLETQVLNCVFATQFIRNFSIGVQFGKTNSLNTNAFLYSTAIPHFYFKDDYSPCYEPDDYLLFMGRLAPEKGLHVALEATNRLNKRLLIAGQGDIIQYKLHANAEYVGFIDDALKRNELVKKARAVIMPTQHPEPFGMVLLEALMHGVPVISSDHGSFPEINKHGVTGFRCTLLQEYIEAIENIDAISREQCRNIAVSDFSENAVSGPYQKYFERLNAINIDQTANFLRKPLPL